MLHNRKDELPEESGRDDTEDAFRSALLRSLTSRESVGELEWAAARYCRDLRHRGLPPELMLKDAKRVIEETIDGKNVAMAERAVLSCIQHYFGT